MVPNPGVERVPSVVRHHDVGAPSGEHSHLQYLDDIRVPGQPTHGVLFPEEPFAVIALDAIEDLDRNCAIQRGLRAPVHRAEAAAPHLVRIAKPLVPQLGHNGDCQVAFCARRVYIRHLRSLTR